MEARFFQCWPNVLRGTAMFRAYLNRITRASILHVVCVKIIHVWLGMLSARSASRLFRSFFQCCMFVRWHMFVSFGIFDFGGNGAREEKQNNTLARRFHSALPTHFEICFFNHIFETFITVDSIIQIGEAYDGLGTHRFEGFMWDLLFLPMPRGTSASLVVPTSCWCFPAFGE